MIHSPVLFQEVIDALRPRAGGRYLDVTAGGGGHAAGVLERSGPDGRLMATDADPQAIERVTERLRLYGDRAVVTRGWIDEAAAFLRPQVAMLENLFDPETVILGGGLPDSVIDALIVAMSRSAKRSSRARKTDRQRSTVDAAGWRSFTHASNKAQHVRPASFVGCSPSGFGKRSTLASGP